MVLEKVEDLLVVKNNFKTGDSISVLNLKEVRINHKKGIKETIVVNSIKNISKYLIKMPDFIFFVMRSPLYKQFLQTEMKL